MAELAIDDQAGGELDKAEVIGGAFLPADEQAAEAIEPAVADLNGSIIRCCWRTPAERRGLVAMVR